jgi:4-hydroxybenzoyl-CoA thioesterase/acyl-CoA thioester hydrolase
VSVPGAPEPIPLAPGAFHYRRRVQFAETDLAAIVHFSWYFKYMEEAEHALFRAAGLSIAHGGLHWPRVSATCDYRQPLRFEDEIDVKVRAGFGRRRIHYAFEIARIGTNVATGAMISACARMDATGTLKGIEIPNEIVDQLAAVLV